MTRPLAALFLLTTLTACGLPHREHDMSNDPAHATSGDQHSAEASTAPADATHDARGASATTSYPRLSSL